MTLRYTSGDYLAKNPTWHAEDAPWKSTQIQKMLNLHSITPTTMCDVGCGSGEIISLLSLAYSNCLFDGYDISPQALALADAKAASNIRFHLGEPERGSARFHVALAIDVFEHVDDYIGWLRKLHGLADYYIFHVPLDLSVQALTRRAPIVNLRNNVGHIHNFFKESALGTLEHAGFRVEDWFYTSGHEHQSKMGKSVRTRIARIPRSFLFGVAPDLAVRLLGGYSLLALCCSEGPATARS